MSEVEFAPGLDFHDEEPGPDFGAYLDEPEHAAEVASVTSGNEIELNIVPIDEFAAVEEPGADALVGDSDGALIPEGGDVMLYGDGGAGKTTLSIDLVCHLAAGDDWLGMRVARAVHVLLVENEGPRPLFRAKLRRKREAWKGSPLGDRVSVLEAPWGRFSFIDETWRRVLGAEIASREIDVLVVGPVTRAGMNEAGTLQEVRDFMELVVALRDETGRRLTVVLIHHENKGGQVSGAWEGAGDTLFHIQSQGHGRTRLYVQKARWDSSRHATALNLVWSDGESFNVDEREELDDDAIADLVLAYVREHPGTGWTKVEQEIKGTRAENVRAVRDGLLAAGQIVNVVNGAALAELQERRAAHLHAADDPAIRHLVQARDAGGTQTAIPLEVGGAAASASCVPPYKDAGRRDAAASGRPAGAVDEELVER